MDEYVNPEPPPEISQIKTEDLIGNTLFSKPWLCTLLLKLIKKVETFDSADQDAAENSNQTIAAKELDPNFEKELCDLWDMSVEKDVCVTLDELNSSDIFEGYIKNFYQIYPRATEILIGILVNMATNCPTINLKLVKRSSLIQYLFFKILASMTDVQSVIQTLNLFSLFFTDENVQTKTLFIDFLNDSWDSILGNYIFILDQSLNPILLDSATNFLFCLLDSDNESLISSTVSENLAEAVCNAAMTRLKLERVQKSFNHSNFTNNTSEVKNNRSLLKNETPTPSASRTNENNAPVYTNQFSEEEISMTDTLLNKYFLCLQTMSTCEAGVEALFLKFEFIRQLFTEYLDRCLVTFNDWEIRTANSLKASVAGETSMQNLLCMVSTLNCVFINQPADLMKMTGSLVEFLIKLVMFCKQYLKLFKELTVDKSRGIDENQMVIACQNYELVKTNLRDLFRCIKAQKVYESYHLNRLLDMINKCDTLLV